MAVLLATCTPARNDGSAGLDRAPAPALLQWLRDREPSRLDVSGVSFEAVRRADPAAFMRVVSESPSAACRQAARDRALLLIYAPVGRPIRAAALDCGFALWRDDRTLVVAPR